MLSDEIQKGMTCSQCGQSFYPAEVVTIRGLPVCAQCKPFLIKRIQEGDEVVEHFVYKGFWPRYWAKIIDGIIQGVGNIILTLPLILSIKNDSSWLVLTYALSLAFTISYYVFFNGKYGATPGKMAIGAKIVNIDGTPISYQKALGRYFAEILSAIPFSLGYLMVIFDSRKRALHDRICGTIVIKK